MPYHVMCCGVRCGCVRVMRYLLQEEGASIHHADTGGFTPLHNGRPLLGYTQYSPLSLVTLVFTRTPKAVQSEGQS